MLLKAKSFIKRCVLITGMADIVFSWFKYLYLLTSNLNWNNSHSKIHKYFKDFKNNLKGNFIINTNHS